MPEEKLKLLRLFTEIQEGNRTAFDELFSLYYHKLSAFAKQYTKQQETAEEITSELFVKLWLKRNKLSTILKPEVYLYVSIKNACLNLIRSDKNRAFLFAAWPDQQSWNEPSGNDGLGIDNQELLRLLNEAVAALPAQRRLIFEMVKEHGLKSKVVAEVLGLSKRTVENQLYKAIKTIADAISGYLGYHPQQKLLKKQGSANGLLLFFC